MESYSLLKDLVILLAVAVPVSFLFHRMKLPSIIGFLITGMIAGPHGAQLVSRLEAVHEMAGIGVVLLLFTIGLEFSLRQLFASGFRMFFVATAQIVLTIALTAIGSRWAGIPLHQGIFLGFLFALSSTAIVLKLLAERGEIDTPQGKLSVGILLYQDLYVIPMMLMIPVLSGGEPDPGQILKQLATAAAAVAGLFMATRYLVPPVLKLVVRSRDLFLITVLLLCLGTAYASSYLGLSLAFGAFIAGLVISESTYSHQILSDILPFRDTFSAIFFISIGMLLDFTPLLRSWHVNLALAGAVLLGKSLILVAILLLTKHTVRISAIAAFGLSQVGEFSFLLAEQSRPLQLLPDHLYQLFLTSSVLTMLVTPLIILLSPQIALKIQHFFRIEEKTGDAPRMELSDHLLIVGFGLNGKNLSRVVRDAGIPFLVIELSDQLVREARQQEIPVVFGDATRKEVLSSAGAQRARMVVVAISDVSATRRCVAIFRDLNRSSVILVRTRYVAEVDTLMSLGADLVIPEEFETSIEIFARVLEQYRIPDHLINQQIQIVRSDSYGMLRGLSLTQERLMKMSELFLKSTIQQVVVTADSPAKGKTVRELSLRKETGATILAALRNEQAITNPDPDFLVEENDVLVLWGAHQQLAEATARLTQGSGTE